VTTRVRSPPNDLMNDELYSGLKTRLNAESRIVMYYHASAASIGMTQTHRARSAAFYAS